MGCSYHIANFNSPESFCKADDSTFNDKLIAGNIARIALGAKPTYHQNDMVISMER